MRSDKEYLLEVIGLTLSFPAADQRPVKSVLNNVSFGIRRGEILGIVGESGCGKTITALSVAGLLPPAALIESGRILLNGQDLLALPDDKRRRLLGQDICMIFQEPLSALNPLMTIGKQLTEVLTSHSDHRVTRAQKAENHKRILEMLANVGFDNPSRIYNAYPHQISGGQRQRALIAGCLLLKPSLLIADEPTTALDTVTQAQILDQIRRISSKLNLSVLFISHNLLLVEKLCDRAAVRHDSKIIECDSVEEVLHHPKSPYTAELLMHSSFASLSLSKKLPASAGSASDAASANTPGTASADVPSAPSTRTAGTAAAEVTPLLSLSHLNAGYEDAFFQNNLEDKDILSDVSLAVYPGEIMGLVGTSGGGKTTLARVITGLLPASSGQIFENGRLIFDFSQKKLAYSRPSVGLVFQDPYSSLNPYKTISWLLEEPLRVHRIGSKTQRREQVLSMMKDVGLPEEYLNYYPHQLSGGLRQRVAIAMSLMLSPSLIIADEPVSALDVSVQAQILKLLWDLHEKKGTAFLFISHDLRVIRTLCSRVAVMENGRIVESGTIDEIFTHPKHAATKNLINAEKSGRFDEHKHSAG